MLSIGRLIVGVVFIHASCSTSLNRADFEVDYSYDSGWGTAWSLKINSTGHAFFCERCRVSPAVATGSFTVNEDKLDSIKILIQDCIRVNPKKYYNINIVDQMSQQIFIRYGNRHVTTYCYGDTCPLEFDRLTYFLSKMVPLVKPSKSDSIVEFKSLENFYQDDPSKLIRRKQFP